MDKGLDKRLKEVHQSDLMESRLNLEFVEWLKTKGMNYLLVVLLLICGYLGWVRWQDYRESGRKEAWKALDQTRLPNSLEEVAVRYEGVDAVSRIARLNAADILLYTVISGKELNTTPAMADPNDPTGQPIDNSVPLTPEGREDALRRSEAMYRKVAEADDGSLGMALHAVAALNGLAAVAECKGDFAQAKQWRDKAASRAEANYPKLAEQTRAIAAAAETGPVTLPVRAPASTMPAVEERPVRADVEPWVHSLLQPAEDESDDEQ